MSVAIARESSQSRHGWWGFGVVFLALWCWWGMPAQVHAKKPPLVSWEIKKDVFFFWLNGEYRPRFELLQRRDMNGGGQPDRLYISHRARFAAGIRLWNHLTMYVQLQDVRNWGTESDPAGDYSADGFDLHQGWMEIEAWGLLSLKIGRMELNYDNQRLIGALNWAQQARVFDAIQLKIEPRALQLHFVFAKLSDVGQPDTDHLLTIAWFRLRLWKFFQPALSYIVHSNPANNSEIRHNIGIYIQGAGAGLKYTGEFFFQVGSVGELAARRDIQAWLGALSLQYTIASPLRPTFVLWADFVSGNGIDTNDNVVRAFDTFFATNHKFYGLVDMFLNLPAHTGQHGLMDFGLGFRIWPVKGFLVRFDFHYFRLFGEAQRGTTEVVQELGPEFDFVVKYSLFNGFLGLSAGYGFVIPLADQGFSALGKGNDVEHWVFMMADVKF